MLELRNGSEKLRLESLSLASGERCFGAFTPCFSFEVSRYWEFELGAALKVLLGPDAKGFPANTVSRLKREWAREYEGWHKQPLDKEPWVYIWAASRRLLAIACLPVDGVYSGLRGEHDKLCALVIIGVNTRGEKHFLAIEDGVRGSTQSWREVLLSLKSCGINTPKLAIGPSHGSLANHCRAVDGALGFWSSLEEVYPLSLQQRCWQSV